MSKKFGMTGSKYWSTKLPWTFLIYIEKEQRVLFGRYAVHPTSLMAIEVAYKLERKEEI